MKTALRILTLACICYLACTHPEEPPASKREFRAVWVATVHNIDWPSERGGDPQQQQQEFLNLVQRQKRNGMNALIVQVRPSGDALYESHFASWSEYLTGTQGKHPGYDPMDFMIKATHAENLEFHAWFNPFRAVSHVRFSSVAEDHISRRRPEWMMQYGERLFFNPGLPEVRNYLIQVILEAARKYDLDGVHFDDYFYPYKKNGKAIPDQAAFRRYGQGFSKIEDWRRHNMNTFIRRLSDSLHQVRPHLKFGISPVGIWRNKDKDPRGSHSRVSHSAYDMLFADVRKWLQEGWIDYVAPQLYWSTDHPYANYAKLLPWWAENSFGRHLYIGHAMFKVKTDNSRHWKNPTQLPLQLKLKQGYQQVLGSVFYSANSFEDNPFLIEDQLRESFHRYPSLIPPMRWKDSIPPLAPDSLTARRIGREAHLNWQAPKPALDGDQATYYVVYRFPHQTRFDLDNPANIISIQREARFVDTDILPKDAYTYVITSVDRMHNESLTCAGVVLSAELPKTIPKTRPEVRIGSD